MQAMDFLTSAQELLQGHREVDYRNAASRAYYSIYHICQESLGKLPNLPHNVGATHQKLILDLLSHPDEKVRTLGRKLRQMKTLREKADYQLQVKFSRYEATQLISLAKKMGSEVDDFLQTDRREEDN